MKLSISNSLLSTLMCVSACTQASGEAINKETVKTVNLQRYMGKWYEIARFDHRFERGMVGATATYTLLPNGKVEVLNSGYQDSLSGVHKVAKGRGKCPNPSEPGKLKVAFFLWFYADYYVLELDEVNYSYALIGSKSNKYLWILSRTPHLAEQPLNFLLERAKQRGYDTSRLIWVKQE